MLVLVLWLLLLGKLWRSLSHRHQVAWMLESSPKDLTGIGHIMGQDINQLAGRSGIGITPAEFYAWSGFPLAEIRRRLGG